MEQPQALSPSQPIVRDAVEADIPDLERCLPTANHRQRIATADGRRARYLVVELDGHVVGFGRLVLAPLPDRHRPVAMLPWIANLNVREDCRGRGLGRLLIGRMEAIAQEHGFAAAYIGSNHDNAPAMSLYRRLGYAPLSQPPGLADHPRNASVVYMVKRLR